jgi:hypothetical protein
MAATIAAAMRPARIAEVAFSVLRTGTCQARTRRQHAKFRGAAASRRHEMASAPRQRSVPHRARAAARQGTAKHWRAGRLVTLCSALACCAAAVPYCCTTAMWNAAAKGQNEFVSKKNNPCLFLLRIGPWKRKTNMALRELLSTVPHVAYAAAYGSAVSTRRPNTPSSAGRVRSTDQSISACSPACPPDVSLGAGRAAGRLRRVGHGG